MQHIGIADLTASGATLSSDVPYETMEVDASNTDPLPDGTEPGEESQLSRDEERALTKESTAGFTGEFLYLANTFISDTVDM